MLTIDSWPAKTHRVTQDFANALAPTVAPPQTGTANRVALATCNTNRSNLQSRHFPTRRKNSEPVMNRKVAI